MYREHSVGVVVPAYNEEGYVGEVVDTMPAYVDRVYVVDDASTDDTWAEITGRAEAANAAIDPEVAGFAERVVPIQHEENRGVGGAIKTGYQRALTDGVDVTAVMGGDGQMNPDQLSRYLDPIVEDEADYTKGNRFMADDLEAMPRFRLVGNTMLTLLTKVASGYWSIGDPQNGYTAISREALAAIDLEDLYEYYGYCNELLVRLNAAEMRVADVARPVAFGYDEDWKSHIEYSEYIPRVSGMLLRSFLWRLERKYLRHAHPVALCFGLGALLLSAFVASLARRTVRPGALLGGAVALIAGLALDGWTSTDLGTQVLPDEE